MSDIVIQLLSVLISALVSVGAFSKITDYRLKSIEARLDQHNHYADLFVKSHEDIAVIKTDLKNLKEDVSELKERH